MLWQQLFTPCVQLQPPHFSCSMNAVHVKDYFLWQPSFFTCQCMSAHGALNYSAQFWPPHFLYVTAPVIIFLLKVNQVKNSNGNFRCVSMAVVFPTTKTQSTTATEVFFDEQGRRRSATRSPRSRARPRRGSPASCCLATAL